MMCLREMTKIYLPDQFRELLGLHLSQMREKKATYLLSPADGASTVIEAYAKRWLAYPVDTTTGTCALSPVSTRYFAAGDAFRSSTPSMVYLPPYFLLMYLRCWKRG